MKEAGARVRGSASKISRMETGDSPCRERDVEDLLDYYDFGDPQERAALLRLVRQAQEPGWWHEYRDVLPAWVLTMIGLEETARSIRTYETQFVPGLLQTPEYARALARGALATQEEDVERRVSARLARQERVMAPGGPRLWAVVDEAVVRRTVGGPAVMRGQVEHLLELAAAERVVLQVQRFTSDASLSPGTQMTLLQFARGAIGDLVYYERMNGAEYHSRPEVVDECRAVLDRLAGVAMTADETVEWLRRLLAE